MILMTVYTFTRFMVAFDEITILKMFFVCVLSYVPQSELERPVLKSVFRTFSLLNTWMTWFTSGGNWQLRGIKSMKPAPLWNMSRLEKVTISH